MGLGIGQARTSENRASLKRMVVHGIGVGWPDMRSIFSLLSALRRLNLDWSGGVKNPRKPRNTSSRSGKR